MLNATHGEPRLISLCVPQTVDGSRKYPEEENMPVPTLSDSCMGAAGVCRLDSLSTSGSLLTAPPAFLNPHFLSLSSWERGTPVHSLWAVNAEASSNSQQETLLPNPREWREPEPSRPRELWENHRATNPRIWMIKLNRKECWGRCFYLKLPCFLTLAVSEPHVFPLQSGFSFCVIKLTDGIG